VNEKKPGPDWELAERLYRAGQLTVREVARQCNVSAPGLLKKAKKVGWTRDLTEKVREAVNTKLVNSQPESVNKDNARKPDPAREREIVEQAADNAVAVVRAHRRDLTKGQQVCTLLFDQLEHAATNRHELEQVAQEEAGDGSGATQRLASFRKALSLPTHAGVIRDLSTAMKNFQALERIAWNLDDKDDTPPDYEAELKRLALSK
jgi:hypothetical protein